MSQIIVLTLILAALGWWAFRWLTASEGLPPALSDKNLVFVEHEMRAQAGDTMMVGRFDRVYRMNNGVHIPVELKSRAVGQVRSTDVDQLSLQAWLLRKNGHSTAFGYVLWHDTATGFKQGTRVNLYDDEECEAIIARHYAVMSGAVTPVKCKDRKCHSCCHLDRCNP